jgi:hypothetical protein
MIVVTIKIAKLTNDWLFGRLRPLKQFFPEFHLSQGGLKLATQISPLLNL